MMNNIVKGGFTSIEQATGKYSSNSVSKKNLNVSNGTEFSSILSQRKSIQEAVDNAEKNSLSSDSTLRFSKHAGERLEQRDIQLTSEQLSRLQEGSSKAGSKGIKESLVLMDNMAFIVNTQKNIVITAMDQNSTDDKIYTNIDGAVII